MADDANTKEHVYRLSSIDQSLSRTYIRWAVCFSCKASLIDTVTARLDAAVKCVVSHLPILAGSVRPADIEGQCQSGQVEVAVKVSEVSSFAPIIKQLNEKDFGYTYENLVEQRMPPLKLISDVLTPLPDLPVLPVNPAFAVQGNFICGGLVVAIYLHHSVADFAGFRRIVNDLSSGLCPRELTNEELEEDVADQSRIRGLLSVSSKAKAEAIEYGHLNTSVDSVEHYLRNLTIASSQSTCHMFHFDVKLIERTKELANGYCTTIQDNKRLRLSAFDVLATVLWKAVVWARYRSGQPIEQDGQHLTSTLVVPVDIRKRVDPPLDKTFFGNAVMHSLASAPMSTLLQQYDPETLASTACLVRMANARVTDTRVRSVIAEINESSDVQSAPIKSLNSSIDLVITSWADLSLENAHLDLGLGTPEWGRKLGRGQTARGCIVHPVRREEGLWEVMVQLSQDVMDCLISDDNFMEFVQHVA